MLSPCILSFEKGLQEHIARSWLLNYFSRELPGYYPSDDFLFPRPHFSTISLPSVVKLLLYSRSSPSPAIAVNPQANLLSISICRDRLANWISWISARACSTRVTRSPFLFYLLLPRRLHAMRLNSLARFSLFFFSINCLRLVYHVIRVTLC